MKVLCVICRMIGVTCKVLGGTCKMLGVSIRMWYKNIIAMHKPPDHPDV